MAGTRLRTNLEGTDTEPCFLRGRGGNNCFQPPLGNELAALRTARFRPWSTLGDKLQRTPCRTRLLSSSSSPQPSRYPNLSPTLAESGAGQALGRTGDISAVGSSTEPQRELEQIAETLREKNPHSGCREEVLPPATASSTTAASLTQY